MPLYTATIEFKGLVQVEYEAMGDPESGDVAGDIFYGLDKGRLNMAEINITGIVADRMPARDIAEHKAEARGDI
jgi:hypothetical protein